MEPAALSLWPSVACMKEEELKSTRCHRGENGRHVCQAIVNSIFCPTLCLTHEAFTVDEYRLSR